MKTRRAWAFVVLFFATETVWSAGQNDTCSNKFAELGAAALVKEARAVVSEYLPLYMKQFARGLTYGNVGNVTFYPLFGPIKVLEEGVKLAKTDGIRSVWRAPFRVLKEDGGTITAVATVAYVAGEIQIEQLDFNEETKEFRSQLGKQNYVYVDMLPYGDRLSEVPKYDFEIERGTPKTYFIRARSYDELVEKLTEFRNEHGEVYGLSLFNHGTPGAIGDINSKSLLGEPSLSDIFAPDGKLLLNSCNTAKGRSGETFAQDLGAKFFDRGGTVYSSKATINSNIWRTQYAKLGLSPKATETVNRFLNGIATSPTALEIDLLLTMILSDEPLFEKERTLRTEVPPRK